MARSSVRFTLPATEATAAFARIRQWLQHDYSQRDGFRLREGLYWPRAGWQQHQIDFYLGSRAGFQIAFGCRHGSHEGEVIVRPHGALDDTLQVAAAALGVSIAVIAFLLLLTEGLGWHTFIVPYPVRAYGGPHASAGAVVAYAFLPAVAAGIIAFVLAWPLTWLARPLCRAANRARDLPPTGAFAEAIAQSCRAAPHPAAPATATSHRIEERPDDPTARPR